MFQALEVGVVQHSLCDFVSTDEASFRDETPRRADNGWRVRLRFLVRQVNILIPLVILARSKLSFDFGVIIWQVNRR